MPGDRYSRGTLCTDYDPGACEVLANMGMST